MGNKILCALLIILYLLTNSCSHTKYLEDGEYLVTKNTIKFKEKRNIKKNKEVTDNLLGIANPKPNSGFLNIPLKIYRLTKDRKEKGIKNYLYKTFAEEPSLYDPAKVDISKLKMNKYLLDHGYIGSQVTVDTITKRKTIEIEYNVDVKKRHTIRNITQVSDTTNIGVILRGLTYYSKLKVGAFYSKESIDAERLRLSKTLRNRGYLNISEENFFFTIDTQFLENVVDITMNYKLPKEENRLKQFKLGNTYIHSLTREIPPENFTPDTVFIKPGMYDIQYYEILRPNVLDITIDQDSSDLISIERQQLTINHFISYGLFKFVNQKYSDPYGDSLNILDRHIYLTPGSDASLGAEFELNNRSGNFFGTAITSSFSNSNTFRGAEIFSVGVTLGTEVQFNRNQSLLNTLIADVNLGLDIPRLLIPFFYKKPSTFFIPHTKINFSNLFESRLESYTALRSSFNFSYQWRETKKSNHLLSPLSVTYLDILSTSALFQERLETDRRLFLSLQDIIDLGLEYTFTYTNQSSSRVKNYSYLNVSARLSGNTLNAVVKTENADGQKILFNTPFSQYSKLGVDYRLYFPFRKSQLVARVNSGIAYAYGNADEVPYNEQFVVGGSQSLRGFDFRGLGPGSYVLQTDPDNIVANQFYDQTGDILIEMNLEYRFPMIGFLKGAVFMDAGNIWLINANVDKPGGLFESDKFLNQIAVNTGYGFRLDFNFLLIRLDLGLVLRRPYLNEGFDWTLNRSGALSGDWFSNNLNFQLGIGYPF